MDSEERFPFGFSDEDPGPDLVRETDTLGFQRYPESGISNPRFWVFFGRKKALFWELRILRELDSYFP